MSTSIWTVRSDNKLTLFWFFKSCHTLSTVCRTPLALWLKSKHLWALPRNCVSSSTQSTPEDRCNWWEMIWKNNLTYFSSDICPIVWRIKEMEWLYTFSLMRPLIQGMLIILFYYRETKQYPVKLGSCRIRVKLSQIYQLVCQKHALLTWMVGFVSDPWQ